MVAFQAGGVSVANRANGFPGGASRRPRWIGEGWQRAFQKRMADSRDRNPWRPPSAYPVGTLSADTRSVLFIGYAENWRGHDTEKRL